MKGITHAYAVALAGLSLMMGCGSYQDQHPSKEQPLLTHISGKVAPGSLWNGIVTAVELDNDGNAKSALGWALTDENGLYEISLEEPYSGGVILLDVRFGQNTKIKCPSLNGCADSVFGEWMDLGRDLIMNAVCAPGGEKGKAHITPLTHMAASRVLSSGMVTPSAAARANSEVSQMVGVSVLTCDIGDIDRLEDLARKGGPCLRHTLFLAGMADFLISSHDGSYELAIQALSDSFLSGTLGYNQTRTIIDRVKQAMVEVFDHMDMPEQYTGDIIMGHTSMESIITNLNGKDYNPEPSDGAGKASVDQAKLLLNQARTFVMQILENQTEPLSSLRIESVSVDSFMDKQIHRLIQLLGETLRQVLDNLDLPGMIGEENLSIFDHNLANIGEVYVAAMESAQGVSWTINGDLWAGVPIRIADLNIRSSLSAEDLSQAASLLDEGVFLTVDGRIENEFMSINLQHTRLDLTARDRTVTNLVFDGAVIIRLLDRTYSGQATLTWNSLGSPLATPNVTWTQLDGPALPDPDDGMQLLSQAFVSLEPVLDLDDFCFEDSAFSLKGSKTIPLDNLSETTHATIDSYIELCQEGMMQPVTVAMMYPDQGNVLLSCQGMDSMGSPVQNTIRFGLFESLEHDLTDDIFEDYGGLLVPSQLSFHTLSLNGEPCISLSYGLILADLEDLNLFIQGRLTATVSAIIPEMPALTATVSVSRNHGAGGSLSMTICYAGKNYTLYFESPDLTEDLKGTLILSNPDDVRFVIHASKDNYKNATGTVYVGGETVGRIQIANGIPLIRYVDGTFESLF